jgi:CDP-diacylglycerol--serine O-phosphatidyltransferase
VVRLLPSVITILALSAGLSAVKFALDGQLGTAIGLVGAAAVLDSLDGRIARMLDATSKIGAELDSLSDAIAFGVAPALVLYVTLLDGSAFGWIVALLYAVSIVLRLARFNTLLEDDSVPAYAREYFVGVPSPAGALVALAPVAAYIQWGDGWWSSMPLVAVWTLISAALIVSRVPTLAMKSASVPARLAVLLLALVAVAAAALVTYPFVLMLVLVGFYLLHIPFAIRSQRWVAARPETWDIKPAERRAIRARTRAARPHRAGARRVTTTARSATRLGLRRPRGE